MANQPTNYQLTAIQSEPPGASFLIKISLWTTPYHYSPHNPEHTKPPNLPTPKPIPNLSAVPAIHVRVSATYQYQCDFILSQWIKITLHQVDMNQPAWIQTLINMCHQYLPESAIQPQRHDTHLSDIVYEISNEFLPGFLNNCCSKSLTGEPLSTDNGQRTKRSSMFKTFHSTLPERQNLHQLQCQTTTLIHKNNPNDN